MIEDDDLPPVREDLMGEDLFQWVLTQLCSAYFSGESEVETQTQSFNLWLKLGDLLNVFHFLPHHKAIVLEDTNIEDRPILAYILTTNKEVLEDLTEEINEKVVEKLSESIEERKKKYS
jgi:hypothetical protein